MQWIDWFGRNTVELYVTSQTGKVVKSIYQTISIMTGCLARIYEQWESDTSQSCMFQSCLHLCKKIAKCTDKITLH